MKQVYTIENLKPTMYLLRNYEPEHHKRINKTMTEAAAKVRNDARKDIPSGDALSNWGQWAFTRDGRDLGFVGAWVQKNIKITRKPMRNRGSAISNFIGLVSLDAAGIIFQTTANGDRKGEVTSNKGRSFVSNMGKKFPGKRGIWKAFDDDAGDAARKIEAAAREAQDIVQKRLDSLGG